VRGHAGPGGEIADDGEPARGPCGRGGNEGGEEQSAEGAHHRAAFFCEPRAARRAAPTRLWMAESSEVWSALSWDNSQTMTPPPLRRARSVFFSMVGMPL